MTDSNIRLATIASQNFTFELLINHDTSLGMELGCNLLDSNHIVGTWRQLTVLQPQKLTIFHRIRLAH